MNQMLKNGIRNLMGACAFVAAGAVWAAPIVDSKPESGTFKMGTQPWLGYGLWHVAAEQKLFEKQGLEQVEVINFNEDKDVNAALASGQIDGASIATHTAMSMVAAGLPVKIVLVLDQSMTADAIIASPEIKSIKDLKGKQVAFEEGTTSDILLHSALSANGMSLRDIRLIPMPASNAGSALIAGQVPVAVTYEPYLTIAKQQNADLNVLYSGKDDPGIVSDVFVVRDDVIEEKPGQLVALVKAWQASLDQYNANTKEARGLIAKAMGASPEELETAFDGVHYFSVDENREQLKGSFANVAFPHVLKAASDAGLVEHPVTPKQMIDARFAEAAK
jgi:NitT/TauT family transport system substrate-binding protein